MGASFLVQLLILMEITAIILIRFIFKYFTYTLHNFSDRNMYTCKFKDILAITVIPICIFYLPEKVLI